jgi:hypothetical protein
MRGKEKLPSDGHFHCGKTDEQAFSGVSIIFEIVPHSDQPCY